MSRRGDLSPAAPGLCVRRYVSEAGEKEVLRVLREQLRRQQHVTSDDVRTAVRAVASQGGAVAIPPDFPPSRWVLEFKRVHGFVQFNSFAFGPAAASSTNSSTAAFGLPERLDVAPLRLVAAAAASATKAADTQRAALVPTIRSSRNNNNSNSSSVAPVAGNNLGVIASCSGDKQPNQNRHDPLSPSSAAVYSVPRPPYHSEAQRQVQLQHGFTQRHRQLLHQQQRRARLVDDRRRAVPWSREAAAGIHSSSSSGSQDSDDGTTTGPSNSSSSIDDTGGDIGLRLGLDLDRNRSRSTPPHIRHAVSVHSMNSIDDTQDSVSNASSSNPDKRDYKLSHTVPAETWEKAIAAVEQQGMSLRAAAKMYGVHFAALHRRVKKRAQGGQAKGDNGYFHPSDEAGIMRVVVARAELGVLMTFDELMRLVEAAALRKLPDISVDSARKLLTRFQSRNEQSIRHIIVDWPPPRPAVSTSTLNGGGELQRQPYLEHPGFDFGPKPPVVLRSLTPRGTVKTTTATAIAAAAQTNLFVPPSRLGPPLPSVGSPVDETRRTRMRFMNSTMDNATLPGVQNDRLRYIVPRARSEGDTSDAVLVV